MTQHGELISSARRTDPAYTLIELLVVVALMSALAGAFGLALRSSGGGMSLQAAQATLASLCNAARGRAVLSGRSARLVVAADPSDVGCYLRYLQIVQEKEVGSDQWQAEGGGVYLPRGVYVVPAAAAAVPGNPAWPASPRSTALSPDNSLAKAIVRASSPRTGKGLPSAVA